MRDPEASLALWDYRRRAAAIYETVRSRDHGEEAWREWRDSRDELFGSHAQSPVPAEARVSFRGLEYFPHDPSWRQVVDIESDTAAPIDLPNSDRGTTLFRRFGTAVFRRGLTELNLTLYWLEAYGGGVFLPFRDATNGDATYGGGRYLLDTAKGADLGHEGNRVVVDFNYAYHPSCVHDDSWSCPLAPPDNVLEVPVEAGERLHTSVGSPTHLDT